MWIVMTSSAAMPSSCMGTYRRVAIVKLCMDYAIAGLEPKMISARARGVEAIRDYGHQNVGKTERCAYRRALAEATAEASRRNREGV
jgi:hypothetical protein